MAGLPAIFDLQIAAINPAQPLQFLEERGDAGRFWTILGKRLKHTDASRRLVLLCPSHERHRHRATH